MCSVDSSLKYLASGNHCVSPPSTPLLCSFFVISAGFSLFCLLNVWVSQDPVLELLPFFFINFYSLLDLLDLMTFNAHRFQISVFSVHYRFVNQMACSAPPVNVFKMNSVLSHPCKCELLLFIYSSQISRLDFLLCFLSYLACSSSEDLLAPL